MLFLEFPQFDSYVKEQLYDHVVGTLEETDGLLKDLIRSTLKFSNTWRLQIHNDFVPPEVFDFVFWH